MDVGNKTPRAKPQTTRAPAHAESPIADPIQCGGLIIMSDTTTTVARTLADNPDGITTKALATAAGLSQATVQKVLTAMEAAGHATRPAGEPTGSRRTADTWHPATATADEVPVADDSTAT